MSYIEKVYEEKVYVLSRDDKKKHYLDKVAVHLSTLWTLDCDVTKSATNGNAVKSSSCLLH